MSWDYPLVWHTTVCRAGGIFVIIPRMNYWLMKTEPTTFSWDDLVRKGSTEWDGVRNYQARNNMRAMKLGDLVFIYHSVGAPQVVGVAKVIAEAHQDSTDPSGVWQCVDVAPVKKLARAILLAEIKQHKELSEMKLISQGRLSVQPLSESEWNYITQVLLDT